MAMDTSNDLGQLEATIYGTVQGVFFRHYARLQALEFGIAGTVENLPDGSVHVVAQGRPEDLSAFVQWLSHGPPLAQVERIEVHRTSVTTMQKGFLILR
jgi:acylphosphatase